MDYIHSGLEDLNPAESNAVGLGSAFPMNVDMDMFDPAIDGMFSTDMDWVISPKIFDNHDPLLTPDSKIGTTSFLTIHKSSRQPLHGIKFYGHPLRQIPFCRRLMILV